MGLYGRYAVHRITDQLCASKAMREQRAEVVPRARGRVLEVGIGTGLNFSYYDSEKVSFLWGLDPSPVVTKIARERASQVPFEVEFVNASSSEIPLDSDSVDTVLMTFILCTVPEVPLTLSNIRRVLKRDGEMIFLEHGLSPERHVQYIQNLINPVRKRLLGGCNINRPIYTLIEESGFIIRESECGYIPGFRHGNFIYRGVAVP